MAVANTFTFGGISTTDYGLVVEGSGDYSAPKRAVDSVEIPGRNGAFQLDKGYYENINVEYKVVAKGATQADFRDSIDAFRNAIVSQIGYQRLEDTYHPGEYRMAMYAGGLEEDPQFHGNGAVFKISFDCKPQRWLTSGEELEVVGEWGELYTESGESISVDNATGAYDAKSLTAYIDPIQSGSGTPSPTNIRPISGHTQSIISIAGKNFLPRPRLISATTNGVKIRSQSNGTITLNGTAIASFATRAINNGSANKNDIYLPKGDYILSGGDLPEGCSLAARINRRSGDGWDVSTLVDGGAFTMEEEGYIYPCIIILKDTELINVVVRPMCRLSGTDDTFVPNDGSVYIVDLGQTVYGASLDVASGVLTITDGYIESYSGETLPSTWISDRDVYAEGTTPTTGAQVVYKLAEPQTVQLTANDVSLMSGINHIWATTGDVSMVYGDAPDRIFNPTPYDASPLLQIMGYGSVQVGDSIINIEDLTYGKVMLVEAGSMNGSGVRFKNTTQVKTDDPVTFEAGSIVTIGLYTAPQVAYDGVTNLTLSVDASSGIACHVAGYVTTNTWIAGRIILDEPFIFPLPSSSTETLTIRLNATANYRANGVTKTWSGVLVYEFGFDNNDMSWHFGTGDSLPSDLELVEPVGYSSHARVVCQSSKLIIGDDPLIVDCDLGEAYVDRDGTIESLNRYIDLGSDLPVLKSGVSEISYSGNIDQLKIAPRWWVL